MDRAAAVLPIGPLLIFMCFYKIYVPFTFPIDSCYSVWYIYLKLKYFLLIKIFCHSGSYARRLIPWTKNIDSL